MNRTKKISFRLPFLLLAICGSLLGCTESDDTTTNCGVVIDGEVHNPFKVDDGQEVTITAIPNQYSVVVRDSDGTATLVLLQGVSTSIDSDQLQPAIDFLNTLEKTGRYYRAQDNCDVTFAGSTLVPGAVVTSDGKSYGEELLLAGFGSAGLYDDCYSDLVENCYAALEAEGQE